MYDGITNLIKYIKNLNQKGITIKYKEENEFYSKNLAK